MGCPGSEDTLVTSFIDKLVLGQPRHQCPKLATDLLQRMLFALSRQRQHRRDERQRDKRQRESRETSDSVAKIGHKEGGLDSVDRRVNRADST